MGDLERSTVRGPRWWVFEFVEGELDLPALDVGRGQLGGRGHRRVEDRGEQPVTLGVVPAVIQGVVDDPHRDRVGLLVGGGADLREPGVIGQGLQVHRA